MPAVVASIVGVPLQSWLGHGYTLRVVPGDPDASALYFRMSVRNPDPGMPPLATEIPDDTGLAAVRAWISSL